MSDNVEKLHPEKELNIDYDGFIAATEQWKLEEQDRNVDAGKTRQKIGEYQKQTGVNGKAFAQVRAGLKMKKETDRQDWLRSMKKLISFAEDNINGNQPDMLDKAEEENYPEPVQ